MNINLWFIIKILLVIISIIFFDYLWKNRYIYVLSWKLPGPFALPLIGNAFQILCKDEDFLNTVYNLISKYESPMRIWLGPKMLVVFRKSEQIEKILSSSTFSNKEEHIYRFVREIGGTGLITESGPKWKADRKLLSPLFSRKIMGKYIKDMVNHSEMLVDILNSQIDDSFHNIKPIIQRTICDLVNETIMGLKTEARTGSMDQKLKTFNKVYDFIYARIANVWLQFDCIYKMTPYYTQLEKGKAAVHDFMRNAYKRMDNAFKDKDTFSNEESFLAEMLKLREIHPNYANEMDFVYHLSTLYTASEDTITMIVSFALVMFGLHPNIQQKAFEETISVLKDKETIDEDILNELKYLEMCIKEVLRLFPIAPYIVRTASDDYEIDDILIPSGSSILLALHNVHRDPFYWKTPNIFNPDHFSVEEVRMRPKYAYMPFSAGPRSCLGKTYAMWCMKVILAIILRQFIIEGVGKLEDYKLRADISVRFHNNQYPIKWKRRI